VAKTLLTHTDVTVYYNSSLGFLLLDADFLLPGMAGLGCYRFWIFLEHGRSLSAHLFISLWHGMVSFCVLGLGSVSLCCCPGLVLRFRILLFLSPIFRKLKYYLAVLPWLVSEHWMSAWQLEIQLVSQLHWFKTKKRVSLCTLRWTSIIYTDYRA